MYDREDVGVVRNTLAACSLHIPLCHHMTALSCAVVVFTADVFLMCSFAMQGLYVEAVVGGVSILWVRLCVCDRVYLNNIVYSIPSLLTSSLADSPQYKDTILSQRVQGELLPLFMSLVKSESAESFFLHRSSGLSHAVQKICGQKSRTQGKGSP